MWPSPDELVMNLLESWEESRRRGRDLSIEELCAGCPHLIGDLRQRADALCDMDRLLTDALAEAVKPRSPENSV